MPASAALKGNSAVPPSIAVVGWPRPVGHCARNRERLLRPAPPNEAAQVSPNNRKMGRYTFQLWRSMHYNSSIRPRATRRVRPTQKRATSAPRSYDWLHCPVAPCSLLWVTSALVAQRSLPRGNLPVCFQQPLPKPSLLPLRVDCAFFLSAPTIPLLTAVHPAGA